MGMKHFFFEKKIKKGGLKKAHFSKSPIVKIFSWKFLRWVLGLVGLNDAKGIDVAQHIWPWGCQTKAQKQRKSTENAFFGRFWAFVGQPHGHISWATSMSFTSFNWRFWKMSFFWVGHFEFKKKKCFIPMKISPNLDGRIDGSKFWCFLWFPENSLLCVILRYTV